MKRIVIAILVLLGLACAAWFLMDSGAPTPQAPSTLNPPATPVVPGAPRPVKETGVLDPGPAAPSKPEPPLDGTEIPLRVSTNVPEAEVMVWFLHKEDAKHPPAIQRTADSKGQAVFVLPVPRANLRQIHAQASARGWTTAHGVSNGADIELRLETGFEVSGRIAFPDGRPIRGVELFVKGGASAATDEAGRYFLGGIPEGKVEVTSSNLGESREVEAGATGVDFVMKRHLIEIRFRDEEGQFVPGVFYNVVVSGEGGTWTQGSMAEDRPLTVGASPGEKLEISCRLESYMNEVVEQTMGKDLDRHEIVVVMKRPGPPGTLSIRATTDDGTLPASVVLTLADRTGTAVADFIRQRVDLSEGKGLKPGIPSGTYLARITTSSPLHGDDYGLMAEVEVRVEAGKETPLDVVIRTGGRLEVLVKDAKGTVIPAERVELVDLDGKEVDVSFGNRTEDGMSFPPRSPEAAVGSSPVPPGRYVVRVVRYVKNEKTVPAEKEVAIVARKTAVVEISLPE